MESTKYKNGGRDGIRAVIFGGAGAEHDISRLSAGGFIAEARRLGFDVLPIFVDKNGDFYIYNGDASEIADIGKGIASKDLLPTFPVRISGKSGFLAGGEVIAVSLAVPVLHGDFGEDGRVQGLLECAGIPFVGADTLTGAVCCDKAYAKAVALAANVRTLPWLTFSPERYACDADAVIREAAEHIGFPIFVKPTGLGSSIGASCAMSVGELSEAFRSAFAVSRRVMAEPALTDKRELECAYLNISEKCVITHPAEVKLSSGFYDFERKYFDTGRVELCERADISDTAASLIRDSTAALAETLGVRHIARFDYFLAPDGALYFNEVNTFPGLTRGSLYTKMLAREGIGYSDFVRGVLNLK